MASAKGSLPPSSINHSARRRNRRVALDTPHRAGQSQIALRVGLAGKQLCHRVRLEESFDLQHFGRARRRGRRRQTGGDLLAHRGRQLVLGHEPVGQPDFDRFAGRKVLAGVDQPLGQADADFSWQALRAAQPGINPQARFRQPQGGAGPDENPIAGQGQLQAAADGQAVHASHHRLRRPLDVVQQRVAGRRELDDAVDVAGVEVPQEEADVGPAYERLADAAEHDAPDGRVRDGLAKGLVQLEDHRRIEAVEGLRPIDAQPSNSLGDLHVQQGRRYRHPQPPITSGDDHVRP